MKKAFRELRVPVCGRFYPNEGGVAGYGNRMRVKYTAKWGLQIAEMIFQTRSNAGGSRNFCCCHTYLILRAMTFQIYQQHRYIRRRYPCDTGGLADAYRAVQF
ncbi:DUF6783 domain-containing protein [Oliverpabstia intestinalis]|uniref:DUF6783 domain-containing protein n=1 Tax=Oliverpabstia intestinalis TaxID=2606633 RepID=UPI003F8AA696